MKTKAANAIIGLSVLFQTSCASLMDSPTRYDLNAPEPCDAYAYCRKMTVKEINYAKRFFRNKIDYDKVRVIAEHDYVQDAEKKGSVAAWQVGGRRVHIVATPAAIANRVTKPGSNVGDLTESSYGRKRLRHEWTHIYQVQHNLVSADALRDYIHASKGDEDEFMEEYYTALPLKQPFEKFNYEKQATLVQNYGTYVERVTSGKEDLSYPGLKWAYCVQIRFHEEILIPVFGFKHERACNGVTQFKP